MAQGFAHLLVALFQEVTDIRPQNTTDKNKKSLDLQGFFSGGISRARTYDLHDVNVAL